ncbi:MAG: hypothetical protein JW770_07920 [Actinobacteria bacterium]|nr:hypothetical protein [Actinomycetota bacterium]
MPIFSYICRDCNEKFDLFVGVGKNSEECVCKKCGSKNIEKTFSSFGIGSFSGKATGDSDSSCPTGTCPFS